MKHIVIGIFLMLSQIGLSQQVTNGFSMPESIISNGERFFVSSQGQDFIKKDGDGFISEISADGKIINQKFLPLKGILSAPKGMTIVNNVLFVADLDRVLGYNIDNRKTVFELVIDGAKLLNDICQLENGFIAVTGTISGNIYKINVNKKSFEIIGNIPTVNGVAYNQKTKQLLVCSNGENYGDGSIYLKTENSEFKELPNIANGFFDGIEWIDNEHILISDWITFPVNGSGKLWIYDLKNQQSEFNITEESIADIYYDNTTSKIYMPQMFHNKVLISDWEQLSKKQNGINNLYNYGVIDAFIGGLYRGTLPMKDLKLKGDFGLGAPNMLNGELTMINGKAYQTKATGETIEIDNNHLTSFASVTFFKADTTYVQNSSVDKSAVLNSIEKVLSSKNKMYAIKISGKFDYLKTRAFPPVENEPFPKLAEILDQQKFFEYENMEGTLVGFFLPSYLNGINAGGFHFHFLSNDKKQGGHILEFNGKDLKIEIANLKTFEMDTPNDEGFQDFKFTKKENESLREVEQGKSTEKQEYVEKKNVMRIGENHYKAYTDIIINASIEQVWEVFTDYEEMPTWSSSLQGIKGSLNNGNKIIVLFSLNGKRREIPHTLFYKEGEELGWSDPMSHPFHGFKDNHRYRVEKISDTQTRFIQEDDFKGIGKENLTAKEIASRASKIYAQFNLELKLKVEQGKW